MMNFVRMDKEFILIAITKTVAHPKDRLDIFGVAWVLFDLYPKVPNMDINGFFERVV